ncbi:deoxynucleoside triphosphate triphosphohydrolase SAMHD1-like isoform X2 [Mya arenaria]|uniref:deoxynucleoside triphosphate triphosphohydrolase SAMHD1-like isoform X2 n=1 Tax=Mya arenaria TaxID=6604 RepID=UPI0022E132DB|nr:deoxynucleoside triphosphate triphosphohydrolase SAMHD1-like isoform X2 [Mya arenaria]
MAEKQSLAISSVKTDVDGNVPPAKRICMSRDKYWLQWDTDDVVERLNEAELRDVAKVFKEKDYVGATLAKLQDKNVKDLCTTSLEIKQLQRFIEDVTKDTSQHKVVNDPIHGHIKLHPLCVAIIDTPEFQRLRSIKQLGNGYFVYPGASHNRFEHSLGVCHIAGKLVRAFQDRQPELGITNKDVLCVEIAGLCHDLGHGPFSHLFDGMFIPAFKIKRDKPWTHEEGSTLMFDHLVKENQLEPEFDKYGLTDKDLVFIKAQIDRTSEPEITGSSTPDQYWTLNGRPKEKSYLYEVVSNKRNGIDVDKWDYFARDCHMLGIRNNFDHNRCIEFSRVISVKKEVIPVQKEVISVKKELNSEAEEEVNSETKEEVNSEAKEEVKPEAEEEVNSEAEEEVNSEAEEEFQICYRDKEVGNLYEMFHTRRTLHSRAYQHKTTKIIETMVTEALVEANDFIEFTGKDEEKSMSGSIEDMKAFSQMTDDVLNLILNSKDARLEKSQEILKKVLKRDLYKLVGQKKIPEKKDYTEQMIRGAIEEMDKDKPKEHVSIKLSKLIG